MGENLTYFFEFAGYRLDPSERRLIRDGKVVPLTPKAFETLCVLVENSGHLVEKDRLMEMLWADAFVEEGNLADNVSKIRHALGDSAKRPKFIETVSGRGYRFIANVEKRLGEAVDRQPQPAISEPANDETEIEAKLTFFEASLSDYASPREQERERTASQPSASMELKLKPAATSSSSPIATVLPTRLSRLMAGALVVVLTGSLLFYYYWNTGEPQSPSAARPASRSLAVLPFKPLAANSRDESLELGMSDSLITGLSGLRQITVRPISAVRRYTDLEQDAAAAGRELLVESVLEGNIQREGDHIRITARLVRAEDGRTLWTETFDEKFTNIFAVQDLISQRIIGALALQLSGEETVHLTKKYTTNTEAYQLYLKGRFFWNKVTPEGFEKSLDFYRQAIDLDPNYALAYAGLADSYNVLGSYGVRPIKESHPMARAAAEKALEIDGELAEAHTSLAAVISDYYWDWPAAERHFKRAIALSPNYPVAHYWYSQYLARMGRLDESIEETRRAQMLDPLSARAIFHVGLALYRARRYDDAVVQLQKGMEIEPNTLDGHIFLGFVYVEQGKSNEALAEFQRVVELSGQNASMRAILAYGYARAGMRHEALAILNEINENRGGSPMPPFETAMINIGLGETDKAFEWLEKAYAERAWQLGFLRVEPIFDPLRADPRFADLMRRLDLPSE